MKVPNILYKYNSAETARVVLINGKLRWSSPCQFNDPNELQRMPVFKPSIENGWSEYLKQLLDIAYDKNIVDLSAYAPGTIQLIQLLRLSEKSKEKKLEWLMSEPFPQQKQMDAALRQYTEGYNDGSLRMFCLSEDPLNDAMWAHYANNHTGCVLGLKHLPELDTPFLSSEPVDYKNDSPVVGSSVEFLLYGENQELREKTRKAIYYTKNIHWAYEKEWRVLTKRPSETSAFCTDFKFYPQELESVTFGLKFDGKKNEDIKKIILEKYPSCMLYRLVSSNGNLKRELIE